MRQPSDQLLRVVELASEAGDDASVGAMGGDAQAEVSKLREARREAELEQLQRHRRHDPPDQLIRRDDHNEPVGRRRHDLLAGVGTAATLDQPARGGDLVGAVDCHVEPGQRVAVVEGLELSPGAGALAAVSGEVETQRKVSLRAASACSR